MPIPVLPKVPNTFDAPKAGSEAGDSVAHQSRSSAPGSPISPLTLAEIRAELRRAGLRDNFDQPNQSATTSQPGAPLSPETLAEVRRLLHESDAADKATRAHLDGGGPPSTAQVQRAGGGQDFSQHLGMLPGQQPQATPAYNRAAPPAGLEGLRRITPEQVFRSSDPSVNPLADIAPPNIKLQPLAPLASRAIFPEEHRLAMVDARLNRIAQAGAYQQTGSERAPGNPRQEERAQQFAAIIQAGTRLPVMAKQLEHDRQQLQREQENVSFLIAQDDALKKQGVTQGRQSPADRALLDKRAKELIRKAQNYEERRKAARKLFDRVRETTKTYNEVPLHGGTLYPEEQRAGRAPFDPEDPVSNFSAYSPQWLRTAEEAILPLMSQATAEQFPAAIAHRILIGDIPPPVPIPPGMSKAQREQLIHQKNELLTWFQGHREAPHGEGVHLDYTGDELNRRQAYLLSHPPPNLTPWQQRIYPTVVKQYVGTLAAGADAQLGKLTAIDFGMLGANLWLFHGASSLIEGQLTRTLGRALIVKGLPRILREEGTRAAVKALGVELGVRTGSAAGAGALTSSLTAPLSVLASGGSGSEAISSIPPAALGGGTIGLLFGALGFAGRAIPEVNALVRSRGLEVTENAIAKFSRAARTHGTSEPIISEIQGLMRQMGHAPPGEQYRYWARIEDIARSETALTGKVRPAPIRAALPAHIAPPGAAAPGGLTIEPRPAAGAPAGATPTTGPGVAAAAGVIRIPAAGITAENPQVLQRLRAEAVEQGDLGRIAAIDHWTNQHVNWVNQNSPPLPPELVPEFNKEWNNPRNPARRQHDVLSNGASNLAETNKPLADLIAAAARATRQAAIQQAIYDATPSNDLLAQQQANPPVAPVRPSVYRQLTDDQISRLPGAVERALLVQDLSNSEQVLAPGTPTAFTSPNPKGSLNELRKLADERFQQAAAKQQAEQDAVVANAQVAQPAQPVTPPAEAPAATVPPVTAPTPGPAVPEPQAPVETATAPLAQPGQATPAETASTLAPGVVPVPAGGGEVVPEAASAVKLKGKQVRVGATIRFRNHTYEVISDPVDGKVTLRDKDSNETVQQSVQSLVNSGQLLPTPEKTATETAPAETAPAAATTATDLRAAHEEVERRKAELTQAKMEERRLTGKGGPPLPGYQAAVEKRKAAEMALANAMDRRVKVSGAYQAAQSASPPAAKPETTTTPATKAPVAAAPAVEGTLTHKGTGAQLFPTGNTQVVRGRALAEVKVLNPGTYSALAGKQGQTILFPADILQRDFGLKPAEIRSATATAQASPETLSPGQLYRVPTRDGIVVAVVHPGPGPDMLTARVTDRYNSPDLKVGMEIRLPIRALGKFLGMEATAKKGFTLPEDLAGAKPGYSYGSKRFTLTFNNDLDRAAYIVAGEKGSKADPRYLKALQAHFPDASAEDLRAMGQRVREKIKSLARDAEPGDLKISQVLDSEVAPKTPASAARPEEPLTHDTAKQLLQRIEASGQESEAGKTAYAELRKYKGDLVAPQIGSPVHLGSADVVDNGPLDGYVSKVVSQGVMTRDGVIIKARVETTSEEPQRAVPLEEVAPVKAKVPAATAAGKKFTLPEDLAGAKPRYSYGSKRFTLTFANDLDRAAYIVAGEQGSKADPRYLEALQAHFPDASVEDLRAFGQGVREKIKTLARDAEPGDLKVGTAAAAAEAPAAAPAVRTPPQAKIDAYEAKLVAKYGDEAIHEANPFSHNSPLTAGERRTLAGLYEARKTASEAQISASLEARKAAKAAKTETAPAAAVTPPEAPTAPEAPAAPGKPAPYYVVGNVNGQFDQTRVLRGFKTREAAINWGKSQAKNDRFVRYQVVPAAELGKQTTFPLAQSPPAGKAAINPSELRGGDRGLPNNVGPGGAKAAQPSAPAAAAPGAAGAGNGPAGGVSAGPEPTGGGVRAAGGAAAGGEAPAAGGAGGAGGAAGAGGETPRAKKLRAHKGAIITSFKRQRKPTSELKISGNTGDPQVDAAITRAMGPLEVKPLFQQIADGAKELVDQARTLVHTFDRWSASVNPDVQENAEFIKYGQMLQRAYQDASNEVNAMSRRTLDRLKPAEQSLVLNALIVKEAPYDLGRARDSWLARATAEANTRGSVDRAAGRATKPPQLPPEPVHEVSFGITSANHPKLLAEINRKLAANPRAAAALEEIERFRDRVSNEYYVAHLAAYGWAPELPNENYIHHEIIRYAQDHNLMGGSGGTSFETPGWEGSLQSRKPDVTEPWKTSWGDMLGRVLVRTITNTRNLQFTAFLNKNNHGPSLQAMALAINDPEVLSSLREISRDGVDAITKGSPGKPGSQSSVNLVQLGKAAKDGKLPDTAMDDWAGVHNTLASYYELAAGLPLGQYPAFPGPADLQRIKDYSDWLTRHVSTRPGAGVTAANLAAMTGRYAPIVIENSEYMKAMFRQKSDPAAMALAYQFDPNNPASPERMAELKESLEGGKQAVRVAPRRQRERPSPVLWLPKEWVPALKSLRDPGIDSDLKLLQKLHQGIMRTSKMLKYITPTQIGSLLRLKTITDLTGAVYFTNPHSFTKLPEAFKIIREWKKTGKASTDAEYFLYEGGAGRMFYSMAEDIANPKVQLALNAAVGDYLREMQPTPKVRDLVNRGGVWRPEMPIETWLRKTGRAVVHVGGKAVDILRIMPEYLDATVRMANYLSFLEKIRESPTGIPHTFGASNHERIMGLVDPRAKASQLAHDAVGNFDDNSKPVRWLNRNVWVGGGLMTQAALERRSSMLIRNTVTANRQAMLIGQRTADENPEIPGFWKKSPLLMWMVGRYPWKIASLLGGLLAANRLLNRDSENGLGPIQRGEPHLAIPAGKGHVLDLPVTLMPGWAEWLHADHAGYYFEAWQKGRFTPAEIAKDMAGQFADQAFVRMGPARMLQELHSGVSPFTNRPISAAEVPARYFGMQWALDLYEKQFHHHPMMPDWKADLAAHAFGFERFENSKQNYNEMRRAAKLWSLQQKGGDIPASQYAAPDSPAFWYREALRRQDPIAAKYFLTEMARTRGLDADEDMDKAARRLEPMFMFAPGDQKEFLKGLDRDDAARMRVAYYYWKEWVAPKAHVEGLDKIADLNRFVNSIRDRVDLSLQLHSPAQQWLLSTPGELTGYLKRDMRSKLHQAGIGPRPAPLPASP